MPIRASLVFVGATLAAFAQTSILPLRDVKAGMKATGRTVFAGTKVEEFGVEILGVLENVGPKQNVILARLSGGPLDKTGVMQGMSGSPVYVDGKLIGAVALSFPFSKDPVAGIRPIEEMIASFAATGKEKRASARVEADFGGSRLLEMATPVWMSGFTRGAVEQFGSELKKLGLDPVQGVSGGGSAKAAPGDPKLLEPGSMISVQLLRGDMSAGADGTITMIDGNRVYGFGHRFLGTGEIDAPFARAEVLTLLASQQSSFKISTPKEWMGAITSDRSAAIAGLLGRQTKMTPVAVRIRGDHTADYKMEMVNDRLLAPLLMQMIVYSSLEAADKSAGTGTVTLKGRIDLQDGKPSVPLEGTYAAENGAGLMAAISVAAPMTALVQGGFDGLRMAAVDLELTVTDRKRALQVDGVWASRKEVAPGDDVEIHAVFTGEDGKEVERVAKYRVPVGAPAGTLNFTVTDSLTSNLTEYRQLLTTPPRSEEQMLDFLRGLRPNSKAYLRVWRQQASFAVQGTTMPSTPPSLTLLLGKSQTQQLGSKVAEIDIPLNGEMVTGTKTVQVEVKD